MRSDLAGGPRDNRTNYKPNLIGGFTSSALLMCLAQRAKSEWIGGGRPEHRRHIIRSPPAFPKRATRQRERSQLARRIAEGWQAKVAGKGAGGKTKGEESERMGEQTYELSHYGYSRRRTRHDSTAGHRDAADADMSETLVNNSAATMARRCALRRRPQPPADGRPIRHDRSRRLPE